MTQDRESTPIADRRLILASRSPRRRALLSRAGIAHEVRVASGVDDSDLHPGGTPAENWVASLAYLKARAVADSLDPDEPAVVLGADTVCVLDGAIIGQPTDREDARRIIRSFEGRRHDVLTGVALVDQRGETLDLFVDRARVRVGEIGDEAIETYLDSGDWRGKAGAYNLFERLEAGWPIEFEGDETTIVGLPMGAMRRRLRALGLA
ncbi:MAG TPA: septum formation protein Maf [Phycisphaerales bacterium]|nr:septum formation protein Maf [Phycisphaerales bacterium]